jgi:hypothetical protein
MDGYKRAASGGDDGASLDDVLTQLIGWVESSEDEGTEQREASERDRDYYDGRQITTQEAEELKARNQPVIAFNMVQSKVDFLLGMEKQQRSDPKAFPRNPADEDAAEAATDAIRYVCDAQNMPMVASQVWESMIVEGCGGVDVCVEPTPDGQDYDIVLHPVHWDRMIWDPYSREKDFRDAKYLGVITWMDEADLLARWPDAGSTVELAYSAATSQATQTGPWEDRPRDNVWADDSRRRVRVVQMYWKEGEVWHCGTFTRGGWLEEGQESPYVDEYGRPECPLYFVSAYVNRDNWRYGVVRNLIDPQDEINLRHRKAVHLLSVRQVIMEEGAVRDVNAARKELAKPDGLVEVAPGMRFEIQQTGDLSAGQASLLQEAKAVFQTMGPNAALMGKQGQEASGRAIALSQQGGAMEIGALMDVHRHWRRQVYRAIWRRVKQYWAREKWVRVTDDENNIRWAGLNQPQTLADMLLEMDEAEAMAMVQQMGIMAGDPRLQQVVRVKNDVAKLDVDIVLEEGPDIATLQIEQFEALAGLAKAGLPIDPVSLIQASNLRNKDQIIERMKSGGRDPNEPPPPPPPEAIEAQANAKKAEAEAVEAQAKAMIAQIEAQAMASGAMPLPNAPAAAPEPAQPAAPAPDMGAMLAEAVGVLRQDLAGLAAQMQPQAMRLEIAPEIMGAVAGVGDALRDGAGAQREAAMAQAQAAQAAMAPRRVVRGPDGRVLGMEVGS